MRRSIPSAAASAPSSSGAVDEPVQTLTAKRSPRAAASVTRRTSAAGTAFGWPEPVNPLIPTWSPGAMNAAASSADITLSATALHPRRDRSVILTLPPAPEHHNGPASATSPHGGHPGPGTLGQTTRYGSRPRPHLLLYPAGHPPLTGLGTLASVGNTGEVISWKVQRGGVCRRGRFDRQGRQTRSHAGTPCTRGERSSTRCSPPAPTPLGWPCWATGRWSEWRCCWTTGATPCRVPKVGLLL